MSERLTRTGPLEWAVATRPKPGESESGDAFVVRGFPEGALVAVIDGIGHGAEASAAAGAVVRALEAIDSAPRAAAVGDVIDACHVAARRTRGCVLTAAWISSEQHTLTWTGLGNVEGLVFRADATRVRIHPAGGIVGGTEAKLPRLFLRSEPFAPGELVVLATDGAATALRSDRVLLGDVRSLADALLAPCVANDDALVLCARHVAGGGA
jgi:hypothetical protein